MERPSGSAPGAPTGDAAGAPLAADEPPPNPTILPSPELLSSSSPPATHLHPPTSLPLVPLSRSPVVVALLGIRRLCSRSALLVRPPPAPWCASARRGVQGRLSAGARDSAASDPNLQVRASPILRFFTSTILLFPPLPDPVVPPTAPSGSARRLPPAALPGCKLPMF